MERSHRETRHRRPRLSKSADFDRVYRKGRSVASRHLVLYGFPRADESEPGEAADARLGVSVGRKVGGAVERNRVKRRIREAFWSLDELPRRHDFVVVARPSVTALVDSDGMDGLRRDLEELARRLGGEPESSGSQVTDPQGSSAEAA
jgi:ribonuclease P protein component